MAARLCLAAVGTETSGSLMTPASLTGVVTLKPTWGLVLGEGVAPLVRSQDVAGPLARSVTDAALLFSVLSGRAPSTEAPVAGGAAGVSVGLLREDVGSARSPFQDAALFPALLERAARALAAAGAMTRDVTLVGATLAQVDAGQLLVVIGGLQHETLPYLAAAGAPVETLAELHRWNLERPRQRMPAGQTFLSLALLRPVAQDAYPELAAQHQERARRVLADTFAASGTDVLLSISNRHSALYAAAGHPAVSVPLPVQPGAMPIGATLVGRLGEDGRLLDLAAALEAALAAPNSG